MTSTYNFNDANDAFFSDFMKCVSSEQEQEQTSDISLCLITNEPLDPHAIRLKCGHSFNYLPLLNTINQYKQDQKRNNRFDKYDTHCPYCREKTPGLLPYLPKNEKIYGVNMPYIQSFGENSCKYITSSNKECGLRCYFDKCHLHLNSIFCKGTTKAGKPCKYKASSVENYCKIHSK